jgi:hypothetical protein
VISFGLYNFVYIFIIFYHELLWISLGFTLRGVPMKYWGFHRWLPSRHRCFTVVSIPKWSDLDDLGVPIDQKSPAANPSTRRAFHRKILPLGIHPMALSRNLRLA